MPDFEFMEFNHHDMVISSYREACEVIEDLAEIAADIAPTIPLYRTHIPPSYEVEIEGMASE